VADDDEHDGAPEAGTPPELSERRFAENLRDWRERRGVSQVKLAQEMAARGWPWRQQTVTRVESGQRMVRLGEALAVAEILGTSVNMLTASSRETTAIDILAKATSRATEAYKQITEWTQTLLHQQGQLELSVAEAEKVSYYGSSLLQDVVAEARDLLEVTPEQAVIEGREEHDDINSSVAQYNEWARVVSDVVRAYVGEGTSIRSISRLYPVSERTVREILEEQGVEIRGRRRGDAPATPTVDRLAVPRVSDATSAEDDA
jgi:transcriptional regulator with XRE-family HTH domain